MNKSTLKLPEQSISGLNFGNKFFDLGHTFKICLFVKNKKPNFNKISTLRKNNGFKSDGSQQSGSNSLNLRILLTNLSNIHFKEEARKAINLKINHK